MLGGACFKDSRKYIHIYIGALDVFVAVILCCRAADKEEAHGFKDVS